MWVLMVIMWVAITAIAFTYLLSMSAFTPAHISEFTPAHVNTYASVIVYVILVWIGLCMILFLGHTIRLMVRIIKFAKKLIRRLRRRSSSSPSSSSGSTLVNHSAASNLDNLNNA